MLVNKIILILFLIVVFNVSNAETIESNLNTEDRLSSVTSISVDEAKYLYDQGVLFIDVRNKTSWNYGHIDGAVHLDFNSGDFIVLYATEIVEKDTPLVFYSDNSFGGVGALASYMASLWGYEQVYYFEDGYFLWIAKDYPVVFNE